MVQATAPSSSRRQRPVPAGPAPRRRRPPWTRFSAAHGLMVGAGLVAFVLVAAALDQRGATVRVAVARADIPAGAAVSADQVRWSELPAGTELAGQLVSPTQLGRGGLVATQAVAAGQPLLRRQLAAEDAADGLRWLSIPVAREHAAGGALGTGDRVDVIDVVEGVARYVVTGAEVARVGPSTPSTSAAPARPDSTPPWPNSAPSTPWPTRPTAARSRGPRPRPAPRR